MKFNCVAQGAAGSHGPAAAAGQHPHRAWGGSYRQGGRRGFSARERRGHRRGHGRGGGATSRGGCAAGCERGRPAGPQNALQSPLPPRSTWHLKFPMFRGFVWISAASLPSRNAWNLKFSACWCFVWGSAAGRGGSRGRPRGEAKAGDVPAGCELHAQGRPGGEVHPPFPHICPGCP